MAQTKTKSKQSYTIDKAGTYEFNNLICAGYNTGSGNYTFMTFPITINPTLRNVNIMFLQDSFVMYEGISIDVSGASVSQIYRPSNHAISVEIMHSTTRKATISISAKIHIRLVAS